jgi:mRNA interferase RelE/StbE
MPVRLLTDLTRVRPGMLQRVLKGIARLEQWPNVSGAKPLRGELLGHYRLRVGDWRIVFRVEGPDALVVGVAHRKDIYED